MTEKVLSWVSDISEPTDRGVRYINCTFADKDSAYIGKKDIDAAIEVRGLLAEAVGKAVEFTLEEAGSNKHGGTKWKIKAFGEHQPAPFVPGGGGNASSGGRGRSPEQLASEQRSIHASVALQQARELFAGAEGDANIGELLKAADEFFIWLQKTSGSSTPLPGAAPSVKAAASGDPEPTSVGDGPSSLSTPADGGSRVDPGDGEAPGSTCPPHHVDMNQKPQAMGRRECVKCHAWVRP